MKAFLVLALATVAAAAPEAPGGYGAPGIPQGFGFGGSSVASGFGGSSSSFGGSGGNGNGFGGNIGGQTFRHVYVHVAPDDPTDEQARVIRVPGKQDKHVNIIFVKAPSGDASQQTEVILPEQDEQKTIVYVLNRKFNADTDLKIRAPQPTRPTKPEVYFIRYKNQGEGAQQGGSANVGGGSSGGSAGARPVYGAPF